MRVYVAGPITAGDQFLNVRAAILAADELLRAGHAPYVPHLTAYWHMIAPQAYETWLRFDFEWIAACDALVRLPGDSLGADREVAEAARLRLPVYPSVKAFLDAWGRA